MESRRRNNFHRSVTGGAGLRWPRRLLLPVSILAKLGVADRTQAAVIALRHGLVE